MTKVFVKKAMSFMLCMHYILGFVVVTVGEEVPLYLCIGLSVCSKTYFSKPLKLLKSLSF